MNERWKHQIKAGLPFGILMPVIMTSVEWLGSTQTFAETFFTMKFLVKLIIFLAAGIFLIGYSSWREKRKNNEYNNQK